MERHCVPHCLLGTASSCVCVRAVHVCMCCVCVCMSVCTLGFSVHEVMSSVNRDSFASSFPVRVPFLSFCPAVLSRSSSTMLTRSGERRHPCLVLILGKNIRSFTIEYDVSCGLFRDALCQFEEDSIFSLSILFNHKRVLDSVDSFFCIH